MVRVGRTRPAAMGGRIEPGKSSGCALRRAGRTVVQRKPAARVRQQTADAVRTAGAEEGLRRQGVLPEAESKGGLDFNLSCVYITVRENPPHEKRKSKMRIKIMKRIKRKIKSKRRTRIAAAANPTLR
jgi:hypothetical protein